MEKNYTVVNSTKAFDSMMDDLADASIIAYDVESTGVNVRKDTVIGIAVSPKPGVGYYLPLLFWDNDVPAFYPFIINHNQQFKNEYASTLLNLLSRKKLLMHNGSFDIRITTNNFGIDLTDALHADTMLMKHTVDEERPFALKAIAIAYQAELGLDVEREANEEQLKLKAHLHALGASTTKENYELYKGDPFVIGEYACADTDLTFRVYELMQSKLEAEGLQKFFYEDEVMPLYREVTIPMEHHGIPVDVNKLLVSQQAIESDIKELHNLALDSLNALVPTYERDVLTKLYPVDKQAFKLKFIDRFGIELPLTKSGKPSLAKKALESIENVEARGFLMNPVEDYLDRETRYRLRRAIHAERTGSHDVLNLNSKPKLKDIFFNILKEPVLSRTKKGAPQLDDDTLEVLAEKYESAKFLRDYNKLSKLKSTYIDRFLEEQIGGIFYPSFGQHRTVSGRYGSDLQQLPRTKSEKELSSQVVREHTNMVREFFVAGEGYKFIDNDYEQLELHIFSHVSQDANLIELMKRGDDLYSKIGMEAFEIADASAVKDAPNYFKKVYPELRQEAKEFTLGVPYGMKAWQLGKILSRSEGEAQEIIDNYMDFAPGLQRYMTDQEKQAKVHGFVRSEFGRVSHLKHAQNMYRKFGDKLEDYKYRWKLNESMGKSSVDFLWRKMKNELNNAKNFPIQSGAASIVNRAAIQIMRRFKAEGIDGYICAQIHDQLIARVVEADALRAAEIVQDCMENTIKLSVPLKAVPEIANNLREGH